MKYLLTLLLLFHGLIHLMGFTKAFNFAAVSQLTQPISKPAGALWGLSALLFTIATVLFFMKKDGWWMGAIAAAVLSQILIFSSWQDAKFGTIVNLMVLVAAVIGMGTSRFHSSYENEVSAGLHRSHPGKHFDGS